MLVQLISGRGVVLVKDSKLMRPVLTKQNFTSPLLVGHMFREKDTLLQAACADSTVAKYAAIRAAAQIIFNLRIMYINQGSRSGDR